MDIVLQPILSELDPRVITGVVVLLLIVGVLALIKKVIKIGVIVIILALSMSTLGPMAHSFQENYKFNVENGVIRVVLDGAEYEIDKDLCKKITLTNKGVTGYEVEAEFKDEILKIVVPTFMMSKIQAFGNKHDIPTIVQ